MMKTTSMTDTATLSRRTELNDVEIRRQIEEHMERQRLKAVEGELADLY